MADHVLPGVRLLFACDDAVFDTADNKWVVKHPWAVVMLPAGAVFPFRLADLWLYAQLTDGVGTFDVRVEMRQLLDGGGRRSVGAGVPTRMTFPGGQQLLVFDSAFHMKQVPFREAGLYEFFLTADGEELQGQTAQVRVFERWAMP